MALKLYHNPASQHARRVRAAIIELEIDCEQKLVDFNKREHQDPAYLRLNPNGKVPTLDDDGFVIWESNAILCYLADKKPQKNLYGTAPKERAEVQQWLFWESAHFGRACVTLTYQRFIKPAFYKQEPDPALVADGEENFKRFASVLNGHLESRQFAACSRYTIADIALASILVYRDAANIDIKPYRHVQEWLQRIESRNSFKQTAPKA